jgi:hypothetical protein
MILMLMHSRPYDVVADVAAADVDDHAHSAT